MKKIAIFDMQHYEMVSVLHHIFEEKIDKICFLTNKNILSKIKNSELGQKEYDTVIYDETKNMVEYLNFCWKYLNDNHFDLVIFNTIDKNYNELSAFANKLNMPYYTTVHNVNTWLNPPFTLNINALKNYYYRKKILKKTKGVIVLDELQKKYIKKSNLFKKKIIVIPYCINLENNVEKKHNDNILRISIPGGIDGHRRDIDLILEIIQELKDKELEFNFLGATLGIPGKKISEKIYQLKNEGYRLNHYYNKDNNVLFEEKMFDSDIILSPINVNTNYEGIKETYGITKSTGVVFDMMKFEKPGILPNDLEVNENIKSSILKYSDKADLIKIIIELKNNKSLLKSITEEAKKNAAFYSKHSISNNVLKEINF